MKGTVELFGAASCPFTSEMREDLQWKRIDFTEFDVEADRAALERLLRLTDGQAATPVLVEDGRVAMIGWRGRACLIK
jgi:glutaredoxin